MPQKVGDTPAAMLANGNILTLSDQSKNTYLFNPFGNPQWTSAAPFGAWSDNEGGNLLLPDGSVLEGNYYFERYLPSTNQWVPTAQTPGQANSEFVISGGQANEIGPFLLLYTGQVLVLGSNANNGLYTPPTTLTGAGSWVLTDTTPAGTGTNPYNHGDTPACVEPDGKVLTVVSQDPTGQGANYPAAFYEYDPNASPNHHWTLVANPPGWQFAYADRVKMLALPSGQIMVSGANSGQIAFYEPAGTPSSSWRPTIIEIGVPVNGTYTLAGTQLNGLTTGADFGDDAKLATNYPIVSLVSGSTVAYARSFNVDQMAPRSSTEGQCSFRPPAGLAAGTYTVYVTANGVRSSNGLPLTLGGRDQYSWMVPSQSLLLH